MEDKKYIYISDEPDYRHLQDRERFKALYLEVGLIEENQQVRWREEWMKYFAPKANSTILDLGAHNGPNLIHYARLGHTVHGVELSENLISTFKKFIAKEPLDVQQRVKIVHGWIEEFTPAHEYDYVLCTEVLEHVMNPVEILKVARKALKPHGLVYICSPTTLWGNNTHVRAVPVERLRQWLAGADLSPVEIWSEDGRTFCTAQQARAEKIIGLTVVRNEEEIINDTLNHLARFCTGGIYVYDDASTDKTAEICASHPAIKEVIKGTVWDPKREMAQTMNRGKVLKLAQQFASPEDWFVYVDGDEFVEFDWSKLYRYPKEVIGVRMKLYDYYITEEDKHLDFHKRKYLGPEYRKILIAYRNLDTLSFHHPVQREVFLGSSGMVVDDGYVKHYGKSVSIQQWEVTCKYYINYLPQFSEKWEKRRGKAVHTISDFENKLITWNEKEEKGIDLMFLVNDDLNTVEYPVKQCDICGCHNSIPYKVKPAVEWDAVKKFYSDRGVLNYPFCRIPEKFSLVKCSNCGLIYTNPRLKNEIVNKFYDEYLEGKYKGYINEYDPQFREAVFEQYMETITSFHPDKGKLLDVGCSMGSLLKVASAKGWDVCGIEVSNFAGNVARQYGKVYIDDVLERLENMENTFDVIMLVDSLEHFSSPRKVLELVHSKLKKDGIIFIEIPNGDTSHDEMSRHFYLFTRQTIQQALTMVGYRCISFLEVNSRKYNEGDEEIQDRFINVIAYKGEKKTEFTSHFEAPASKNNRQKKNALMKILQAIIKKCRVFD